MQSRASRMANSRLGHFFLFFKMAGCAYARKAGTDDQYVEVLGVHVTLGGELELTAWSDRVPVVC